MIKAMKLCTGLQMSTYDLRDVRNFGNGLGVWDIGGENVRNRGKG
jgi:hypothetical protein